MDSKPAPFVPPVPFRRLAKPNIVQGLWLAYRNPLELWGEPAFDAPWLAANSWLGRIIVVNHPALVRHILVHNAANYRMSRMRQRVIRPLLGDGLLSSENDIWKIDRHILAPLFTPSSIVGLAGRMMPPVERFAARFADAPLEIDLVHEMSRLAYEIMAATLFSGEIAAEPDDFLRGMDRLLDSMGRFDPLDILGAPNWIPRLSHWRGRKALVFLRGAAKETIARRRRKLGARPDDVPDDLLTALLRAEVDGAMTPARTEDHVATFLGAGHETTGRALTWTLYCLAEAPWERALVEEEIDALMAAPPPPSAWLERLPRTRAAFEEAMRLYPPLPTIFREAISDDRIDDLAIEPGSQILVVPWILHRHRGRWADPDAFVPARFLGVAREGIDRYQYLPFGVGPRVCIGAAFAMQELVIALAVLMSRHRFDTSGNRPPEPVQKLTIQPRGRLPMIVSRR